ncbi:MAG: sulfatase-like hydrolase/transferase [Planctomycetota bacterium]
MSRARHVAIQLAIGLLSGVMLWGVLFLLFFVPVVLRATAGDAIASEVLRRYPDQVRRAVLECLWFHLSVGAALGLPAGAWCALLLARPSGRWRRWLASAAVNVLALIAVSLYGMIERPVFLDPFLNLRGGALAALQDGLTRWLHPAWPPVAAVVLLAALVVARRASRSRPRVIGAALLLLALVVPWLRSRGQAAPAGAGLAPSAVAAPAPAVRPNVILIGIDSLRSDHLSRAGYARATTPFLDEWSQHGLLFPSSFVSIARTLPSWACTFTSAYSHSHGIRHMFPARESRHVRMPTLASVLHDHGYGTVAVSDYAGEAFRLVDFGFDITDVPPPSNLDVVVGRELLLAFPLLVPAINHPLGYAIEPVLRYLTVNPHSRVLNQRSLAHIDRILAAGKPFFLTLFYSAPHTPYASPYPYYRMFADPGYQGAHKYAYSVRDPRQIAEADRPLPPEDVAQITAIYDGALREADDAVCELMGALAERGLLDRTIVLVTADHGEHLFEYGNTVDHGKWFRGGDAANRVPIMLAGPGVPARAEPIPWLVRHIDIAPTLLDLAQVPLSDLPPTFAGESLRPLWEHPEADPGRHALAETELWLSAPTTFAGEPDALVYPGIADILDIDPVDSTLYLKREYQDVVVESKHRMLHTGRFKLVYEPTQTSYRLKLFDVEQDPGNAHDLSAQRPKLLDAMRGELFRWMATDPARKFDARGHLVRDWTYFE